MMKEDLEINYMPPVFSARLMTIGTNTLKTINLSRSMSKNSMNFSSDTIPSIRKVKFKFFLDS